MTGDELKAAREALGLSLEQLAAALQLSGNGANRLRELERGKRAVSGPIAAALALMGRLARIRAPATLERMARAMAAADSGPEGSGLFDLHWQEFGAGYLESAAAAAAELELELAR